MSWELGRFLVSLHGSPNHSLGFADLNDRTQFLSSDELTIQTQWGLQTMPLKSSCSSGLEKNKKEPRRGRGRLDKQDGAGPI